MSKRGKTGSRTYGVLEVWHWDRLGSTVAVGGVWHGERGRFESLEMRERHLSQSSGDKARSSEELKKGWWGGMWSAERV